MGVACSPALDLFSCSEITLLSRLTTPPVPLEMFGWLEVVTVTEVPGELGPTGGTSWMASERALSLALDMSLKWAGERRVQGRRERGHQVLCTLQVGGMWEI